MTVQEARDRFVAEWVIEAIDAPQMTSDLQTLINIVKAEYQQTIIAYLEASREGVKRQQPSPQQARLIDMLFATLIAGLPE